MVHTCTIVPLGGFQVSHFLISLDELDRVRKIHGLKHVADIARHTRMGRSTWNRAVTTRRPTPDVLNALASMGARPGRILVLADVEHAERLEKS